MIEAIEKLQKANDQLQEELDILNSENNNLKIRLESALTVEKEIVIKEVKHVELDLKNENVLTTQDHGLSSGEIQSNQESADIKEEIKNLKRAFVQMKPGSSLLDTRVMNVEICEAKNLIGEGINGDNYAVLTIHTPEDLKTSEIIKFRTPIHKNTSPKWFVCTKIVFRNAANILKVEIFDHDLISSDDFVAVLILDVNPYVNLGPIDKWFDLSLLPDPKKPNKKLDPKAAHPGYIRLKFEIVSLPKLSSWND